MVSKKIRKAVAFLLFLLFIILYNYRSSLDLDGWTETDEDTPVSNPSPLTSIKNSSPSKFDEKVNGEMGGETNNVQGKDFFEDEALDDYDYNDDGDTSALELGSHTTSSTDTTIHDNVPLFLTEEFVETNMDEDNDNDFDIDTSTEAEDDDEVETVETTNNIEKTDLENKIFMVPEAEDGEAITMERLNTKSVLTKDYDYVNGGYNSSQAEQQNSTQTATKENDLDGNHTGDMLAHDESVDDSKVTHTTINAASSSKDQLVECTKAELNTDRWSYRQFPKSDVNSLFNCDLDGALCEYYYQSNFFDESCGLGKNFSHYIVDMELKRLNGTLWNFMPSIGFPTLTMNESCLDSNGKHYGAPPGTPSSERVTQDMALRNIGAHDIEIEGSKRIRCVTERLSFIHVHKAGGSSLHEAFNRMEHSKSAVIDRHKFYIPPRNFITTSTEDSPMRKITKNSLEHATKYPKVEFAPEQHIIFAVVRDPLERFISSMGQAMGAQGSGGNHIAPILKNKCVKLTSRETLTCVARYVKEHTFWIELHFTPQALDISFTTMNSDVPVGVFSFEHIGTVLDYFGTGNVKKRDGHAQHYRTDEVLRNMTVDDYEEESLRLVCEIYEMDVLMQRSLGLQVPRCDPYIPNTYKFE